MRKQDIVSYFRDGLPARSGNYESNGMSLFFRNRRIAKNSDFGIEINFCGDVSKTIIDTLNLLCDDVELTRKKDQVYMNGKPILNAEWVILEA